MTRFFQALFVAGLFFCALTMLVKFTDFLILAIVSQVSVYLTGIVGHQLGLTPVWMIWLFQSVSLTTLMISGIGKFT